MNRHLSSSTRSSLVWRASALTLTWAVIAGGSAASWLIGIPTIALATWASLTLAPPHGYCIRPTGVASFAFYFLRESLRGGWDVAMRTLARPMRISPSRCCYQCQLPSGLPAVLFGSCVSLLPGTLAERIQGNTISLHLLDDSEPQGDQLRELEQQIARLLGLERDCSHE